MVSPLDRRRSKRIEQRLGGYVERNAGAKQGFVDYGHLHIDFLLLYLQSEHPHLVAGSFVVWAGTADIVPRCQIAYPLLGVIQIEAEQGQGVKVLLARAEDKTGGWRRSSSC